LQVVVVSQEVNLVEPDAVHPRFQPRSHLLFSCPNCGATKPSEVRIQRHFLKKSCFPVHSACTECGGPVFHYKFGPKETRLAHDCAQWAAYKGRNPLHSETASLADSESVLTQSTENGSTKN